MLEAFTAELGRPGDGPRILNLTGVGGIGKSRLLRELKDHADQAHRTATLDLQIPALRQQEDALAVLRGELGAQGVHFDRFDIAYAVLWQRLHPHLRLDKAELPFLDGSSILTDVVDTVAGLPFFGTARGLIRILERGSSDVRRRMRVRRDNTLQTLDDLPNSDLADAVTYLFAADLRDGSTDKPYVLFVDSYEALVPAPIRSGRAHLADGWLRDLCAQLDTGLVVVASREPLRWETDDPEWSDVVRVRDIGGLPMAARLDLLEAGGIAEPAHRHTVAEASAGLPFYLHLAVDTYQQPDATGHAAVSQSQILARFLEHVAADEIRTLEVLSPARLFDYEVFRLLAARFHLPADRLAWESLTSYSFVYPAGDALRFHQLMGAALAARLPASVTHDVHTALRALWEERADTFTAEDDGPASAQALREAVFHGLAAGVIGGAELLDYADRAIRRGGHSAATGLTDDLRNWLALRPSGDGGDLPEALVCLEAETAVRLGDSSTAVRITIESATAADLTSAVGARLAVAAGNGQRIAGNTRPALRLFTRVWEQATGTPRLQAGLWACDLHMAQGRFRDAEALAADLDALAPADDAEFRGDVARLRHLAGRFAFDFDAARRYLNEAAAFYEASGSTLGLANLETNRAELLCLVDPRQAVDEAGRAIDVQHDIGARHELGKAYTALAVARLRLGDLEAADTALHAACDALDQAGYRSGRARAELYTGLLHALRGRMDEAVTSLRRTVEELEAADVYPTFVLFAAHTMDCLGVTDSTVTTAARRARTAVQPLDTLDAIEQRLRAYTAELLDGHVWKPDELYRAALERTDATSGFYNDNIPLDTPTGPVIVRIPIPGSDVMDLSIWPEPEVLRAIRGTVARAPRLLHTQDNPRFQVHECITGQLLDDLAPRGVRVPPHVLDDVADLFAQLGAVPRDHTPSAPPGWPDDGDTTSFASWLSAVTADVHTRFLPEYGCLFDDLGIPTAPLTTIEHAWARLRPRPFRLLHTDIHRKNMILSGGRTYFLDWELALWGDPVYDLAVHLHKTAYQPDEHDTLLGRWADAVPGPPSDGWEADLPIYLAHERVKSAIVDTVRYTKLLTGPPLPAEQREALLDKLVGKLTAAHQVWQTRRPRTDRETVTAHIARWAAGR
ncbi:aminoglycoside phosphotransferase family protein [Candidatus Protofrankia californiensis]|uniref:aminoglycoside phosphotransferase family protein n=1 Tax=Candidatus Protofrankia californiensis TaxID=1839754 RepID=UPI001F495A91|nr:aminoglycoside phosphotransferase family protein [Candidatus Protofrankia californiensis]